MLLKPAQDFCDFVSGGYALAIIGFAIIFASWITYSVSETKVSKPVVFVVEVLVSSTLLFSFAFLIFFVIRHIFFEAYQYLQLSVSFFLLCLTLFGGLSFQERILKQKSIDVAFVLMGLIMSLLGGALFPLIPICLRFVWTAIL